MENIFIKNLPTLDLHGDDRETAIVKVKDFIVENKMLGNNKIVIVHGIGQGILKKEVMLFLAKRKDVNNYKVDNFNDGCTIVDLII